jgi:hypothetical protein
MAAGSVSKNQTEEIDTIKYPAHRYRLGMFTCCRRRLLGGIDYRGFQLSDFLADKLVNLGIREMPEPNKFDMPKCSCIVFQRNLPSVVKVLDVNSCSSFEPRLFFVGHEALSAVIARLL